jgi:hypothetical protein
METVLRQLRQLLQSSAWSCQSSHYYLPSFHVIPFIFFSFSTVVHVWIRCLVIEFWLFRSAHVVCVFRLSLDLKKYSADCCYRFSPPPSLISSTLIIHVYSFPTSQGCLLGIMNPAGHRIWLVYNISFLF